MKGNMMYNYSQGHCWGVISSLNTPPMVALFFILLTKDPSFEGNMKG